MQADVKVDVETKDLRSKKDGIDHFSSVTDKCKEANRALLNIS